MAIRHLRLVYSSDRLDNPHVGVTSNAPPRVSPNHPAWGNTPMEDRVIDDEPKLELGGSMSGGGKKPPKKKTTTGDKPKDDKSLSDGTSKNPNQPGLFDAW